MIAPEPYIGNENFIFLSFAPEDSGAVMPIATRMQQDGFRVWFREASDGGMESDGNTAGKLSECGYFIAFLSYNYLASDKCKDELVLAKDRGIQQLIIYLEDMELPGSIAMRLGRNQAVFYNRFANKEEFFARIYEAQNIGAFSAEGVLPVSVSAQKQRATTFQRRRRSVLFWIIGLALALAGISFGIFRIMNRDPVEEADNVQSDTASAPTDVLLETERIKVRTLSFSSDSSHAMLELSVDNKTEDDIYLSVEGCYINGVQCESDWIGFIQSGQTGLAEIRWEAEDLAFYGMKTDEITVVECSLSQEVQGGNGSVKTDQLTYYPQGEANARHDSYSLQDGELVLVDTPEYQAVAGVCSYDEVQDRWVQPVILVNRTDKDLVFSTKDESINGYVQASGWSESVPANRTHRAEIAYPAIQWRPSGYGRVLEYTGLLCVNGEQAAEVSHPFAIYPEGEESTSQLAPMELTEDEIVFENEILRVAYLGVKEYSQASDPADLFYVQNLTDSPQEIIFQATVDVSIQSEFSETLYLEAGKQTVVVCGRTDTYGDPPPTATLTILRWDNQNFMYDTFDGITVQLEALG